MADNSRKKLGYRDLARYLIAHKWRLVIALFSMVMVGFFGSFNFLLIKPALEVILGAERSQQSLTVVHRHEDGTTQTLTLRDDGMSPDRQAGDNIYAGYSGSLAGQQAEREAFEVAVAPEVVSKKKARPGEMIDVGFLRSLKTRWDALLRPVGARVQEWDKRLKEYGRTNQMNALLIIAALLVAMSMCHGFFDFLAQYEMTYSLLDMMRRLKDDLFRSVLSQDYLYLVRQTTGYLESRISSDVGVLRNTVDVLLTDTIQAPVRLVFLLLVLLILNFQLTLVAVIVLPLAAVPLVYFARAMRRVTRRQKRQADQLSSAMEESLRNFQVIKCFQSEQIEIQRFTKVNLKLFKYYMQRRIARFGAPPLMEVLGAMGASAVVMIGGYLILAGRMEFSALMVYLLTLTQFYMPLKKLSRINNTIQSGKVSADRVLEMLQIKPQLSEAPDAVALDRIRHSIAFRNVTFIYDDQPVLRDISFEVPVGRTVAIVGQSGAGKTTLACLLLRLFDPQSGMVEIDGRDVRQYRLADLRRRLALVSQETVLFNDTVANNIAYPEREPDMERVERAGRLANAHDFIVQMDGGKGYETVIGQAGLFLSGGQRQRLAIARAIYRDPDVLVLDEATSALDEKSQALVQEAINNLLQGRTAFIIAHRLSTVRNADEILVLDRGVLVERGSHDDLIRRGGAYATLYQMVEMPRTVG